MGLPPALHVPAHAHYCRFRADDEEEEEDDEDDEDEEDEDEVDEDEVDEDESEKVEVSLAICASW